MDEKTIHRIYLEQQEAFRELRRKRRRELRGKSESEIKADMENENVYVKNIVSSSFSTYSASFDAVTYIRSIGVYDEDRNLIAIAKVANPVKKTVEQDYTFKLKLDL